MPADPGRIRSDLYTPAGARGDLAQILGHLDPISQSIVH